MESPASLGAVVRDRRLALGYSLGQLATKVNKTAASIRAWEKGDSFPTREEADALATALDLDVSMLDDLVPDSHVWEEEPGPDVAVVDPWAGFQGSPVEGPEGETADSEDIEVGDEAEDVAAAVEVADEIDEAASDAPDEAVQVENDAEEPVSGLDAAQDVDADSVEADDAEGPASDDGDEDSADLAELAVDGVIDDVIEDHEVLEVAKESLADEAIERPPPPDPAIHEAMTEAVPVVPAAVAVATHHSPLEAELQAATADPFNAARDSNPLIYWWDTAVGWYRQVFDPSRRWIYRVRFVLLLIAFYIMLRVLAWSGSELWDAIGEVLDSISFSPSETPDVTN